LVSTGCGNGVPVDPFEFKKGTISHDGLDIEFVVKSPLSEPPVVEYTVVTDEAKRTSEVSFVVLKKNTSETPKTGVHRFKVEMLDDSRFLFTIPFETLPGYSTTYFLCDNLFDGKNKVSLGTLSTGERAGNEQVSEPEEIEEDE
jgi:hypothetical protein